MDDLISRRTAIDALEREKTFCKAFRDGDASIDVFKKYNAGLTDGIKLLKKLPSARPDLDEWCTDCKEYDQERHCCPRWIRLIRRTLKDAQPTITPGPQWIPVSERLPEDRLYVLVTYTYEYGLIDHGITWYGEAEDRWDTSREVVAWMPLPEPYKEGQDV